MVNEIVCFMAATKVGKLFKKKNVGNPYFNQVVFFGECRFHGDYAIMKTIIS